MEQGTVGVAAGMAMTGLIPVVYSIVNFIVYRALEQVRNDVKLQNLNVKFIATGVDDYFKFLGASHTCGQDDIKIMEMIDMQVYNPYQLGPNDSYDGMVDRWITSKSAGYFRV
jgi:transketolase